MISALLGKSQILRVLVLGVLMTTPTREACADGGNASKSGTGDTGAVQFNKVYPNDPVKKYDGFDNSGTTKDSEKASRKPSTPWLVVPMGGNNQVLAKARSGRDNNKYNFISADTTLATVNPSTSATNPAATLTLTGLAQAGPRNALIKAVVVGDATTTSSGTLNVRDQPSFTVRVAFHYIRDASGNVSSKTLGDNAFAQFLIQECKTVWMKQGNVNFILDTVDSSYLMYPSTISSKPTPNEENALRDWIMSYDQTNPRPTPPPFVAGDWNVYYVYSDKAFSSLAATYSQNVNITFWFNSSPDDPNNQEWTLAHEAGHLLGSDGTSSLNDWYDKDIGENSPQGHSSDRFNLMYPTNEYRNAYVRRYQIDIIDNAFSVFENK